MSFSQGTLSEDILQAVCFFLFYQVNSVRYRRRTIKVIEEKDVRQKGKRKRDKKREMEGGDMEREKWKWKRKKG